MAAGGSVGYRLTPHFGFDVEIMALPDLAFGDTIIRPLSLLFPPNVRVPSFDFDTSGRGLAFLMNFVGEFPTGARWLLPYVQGGGGVANLSQTINLTPVVFSVAGPGGSAIGFPNVLPPGRIGLPYETRMAETNMALTVGGGIDFVVWNELSVGPTLRYFRLFGNANNDRDLTHIGARAAYRF
jgi:hypothetical protein